MTELFENDTETVATLVLSYINHFQGCFISSICHKITYWVTSPSWKCIIWHLQAVSFLHWAIKIMHIMEHSNMWTYNFWGKKMKNEKRLNAKRFGASWTGYVFSTIHSDLVTELFNKETKCTFGPFSGPF